jgi:hypothetical protein
MVPAGSERRRVADTASESRNPRTTLAGMLVAVAVLSVAFAWCRVSPFPGEWNLLVVAVAVAFVGGLLTPYGVTSGLAMGVVVIVVSDLFILELDPYGLTPEVTIPMDLAVCMIPMVLGAWLGRKWRGT